MRNYRELQQIPFVNFHVPHGERAVAHLSLKALLQGRSPFLTKVCQTFQDVTTAIGAKIRFSPGNISLELPIRLQKINTGLL